ncbi:unnamed protein product [Rhizophagus irregularis]|uniref:Uncharacterized protein n=1 Tax=Rhizophagus irregularis TaxID=588596 RepID=A0A915ZKK6_9GLOM|nr:unnamed protein product [Rhizophagus irregularis]
MSDNNLHFNHFSTKNCFNKEANNYKYIFINELEEVKEIDEATNETIDDEIIDKIINVIDDEEDSSCITELWTYSDINKLLDILAVNWELYKNNKTKFCTNAKRGKQVKAKLFNLNRTRYTNDKKEVTGKATST